MDLPKQDDVFYCGSWTRELETRVLMKLHRHRLAGEWIPGNYPINIGVLRQVREEMLGEGAPLDLVAYYRKEGQWEERYGNFNWLVSQAGVRYDSGNNVVVASRDEWADIINIRPEMLLYYSEGEVNWRIMEGLYKEVIDISDTLPNDTPSSADESSHASGVVDQPNNAPAGKRDHESDSF